MGSTCAALMGRASRFDRAQVKSDTSTLRSNYARVHRSPPPSPTMPAGPPRWRTLGGGGPAWAGARQATTNWADGSAHKRAPHGATRDGKRYLVAAPPRQMNKGAGLTRRQRAMPAQLRTGTPPCGGLLQWRVPGSCCRWCAAAAHAGQVIRARRRASNVARTRPRPEQGGSRLCLRLVVGLFVPV
ncbi:hypothetical protein IOCL2690_000738600 [Leishmania lindenbergi]|uniref:Uncharacterized protein n=1 Tax=Leishmania lindenbergi TaxID=651832 RepID=A0AAW3A012_9TRYP